jgi:hypothetical protein
VPEVEKADSERGFYLHPEAHGQPSSLGIGRIGEKAAQLRLAEPARQIQPH